MKRIVLITGGNRGIGYETSRQMARKDLKFGYLVKMNKRVKKQ